MTLQVIPCGGCGQENPLDRCIGCRHIFIPGLVGGPVYETPLQTRLLDILHAHAEPITALTATGTRQLRCVSSEYFEEIARRAAELLAQKGVR